MTIKTFAAISGSVVEALIVIDTSISPGVPGEDVPAAYADDVTAFAGIAAGWIQHTDGSFTAPAVDLSVAKAARAADMEGLCAAAITGGFASSALGAANWYGSKTTDQTNLDADMMAAASGGSGNNVTALIACSADQGATWAVQSHNAAQIGQVWNDFRTWRIACQAKKRNLQASIASATTPAAVAAVTWA